LASWFVWKIPARRAAKLAEFSHTEEGSSLDMMAAAEAESVRSNLRRKFFIHALDEHKHARWFAERATILSAGTRKPASLILDDVNYIRAHGIRGDTSLYAQFGVLEFLAFVWMQERQAGRQFTVYAHLVQDDPVTAEMFDSVKEDERFHTNYSRLELDRMANAGEQEQVRRAVRNVRLRGLLQMWLRLGRAMGEFMGSVWLSLLYFILTPFALAVRFFDKDVKGLVATPDARKRALVQAGLQG
jgi:bacterioferritin (cytochrome b1)